MSFRPMVSLFILVTAISSLAVQNPTRTDAEALLRRTQISHLFSESDLAPFRAMGKKSLPLFAPFLADKELGSLASFAMEEIDPVETTRYMIEALPQLDSQVQSDLVNAANRAMQEYDLFKRAGSPKPKPGEPPPRFPTNQVPYPYKKQVHTAVLKMLNCPGSSPSGQLFVAIGLCGDRRDCRLLRKYVTDAGGLHVSDKRTYALAALARLGDRWALEQISRELDKPIATAPEEPWFREPEKAINPKPGSIVVPEPEGQRLRALLYAAAFSMNRQLLPHIAHHLSDPNGQFHGDYSDPSPPQFAADALAQIVEGKAYGGDLNRWKEWWKRQSDR